MQERGLHRRRQGLESSLIRQSPARNALERWTMKKGTEILRWCQRWHAENTCMMIYTACWALSMRPGVRLCLGFHWRLSALMAWGEKSNCFSYNFKLKRELWIRLSLSSFSQLIIIGIDDIRNVCNGSSGFVYIYHHERSWHVCEQIPHTSVRSYKRPFETKSLSSTDLHLTYLEWSRLLLSCTPQGTRIT